MILIPIVTASIGIGQTYMANVVGQRVMQDFRNALYAHLQHMPLRFFTATRTGEIQSRLQNDVGGVQSVVTDTASGILSNVVTIASTLVAMFFLSWQLTLLSLALLPVFLVPAAQGRAGPAGGGGQDAGVAGRPVRRSPRRRSSVSGILLSKAFGRQSYEIGRYREENERLAEPADPPADDRAVVLRHRRRLLLDHAGARVPGRGHRDDEQPGRRRSRCRRSWRSPRCRAGCSSRSVRCCRSSVEVQSSLALFSRIFEYLDMPHEIADAPDARALAPEEVGGKVRFRDVYFRYEARARPARDRTSELGRAESPEADGRAGRAARAGRRRRPPRSWSWRTNAPREWNLEDVDFEIEPGQLAALVGSERRRQDHDDLPGPAPVRRRPRAPSRSTTSTSGRSSSNRSARSSAS